MGLLNPSQLLYYLILELSMGDLTLIRVSKNINWRQSREPEYTKRLFVFICLKG